METATTCERDATVKRKPNITYFTSLCYRDL